MERRLNYVIDSNQRYIRGEQRVSVKLDDSEISLKLALGYMDYRSGLLTRDGVRDLSDLALIKHTWFFARTDEYMRLYGVDGALRRFRQSKIRPALTTPSSWSPDSPVQLWSDISNQTMRSPEIIYTNPRPLQPVN